MIVVQRNRSGSSASLRFGNSVAANTVMSCIGICCGYLFTHMPDRRIEAGTESGTSPSGKPWNRPPAA
jgi:hypothetical protein